MLTVRGFIVYKGGVHKCMPKKLRTRKPRVLRRRNVKKRTSARAQSKQIAALSRGLASITRKQFAKVHTVWQRNMLSVDTAGGGVYSYVCPIPYVPCNAAGVGQPGGVTTWTDNLSLAAQPTFSKRAIFGVAREAATSNEVYHSGGVIKWQIISNETSFGKYSLFLVRPKKSMADQIVKDRLLKVGSVLNPTLGFASFLQEDLDYVVHKEGTTTTSFGAQMNTKYWDILYRREVTLGVNTAGAAPDQSVNYNAPGDPGSTSLTARGTIKLPAGGMIKNASVASQSGAGNASQATSFEVGYGDQENSSGCYLLCINNGVSAEGESVKLGFLVHDYYKACV